MKVILGQYITIGLVVLLSQFRSCSCARTRIIRSAQHTSFSNNFNILRCAAKGAGTAYAAVRAGVNTNVCDPVTNVHYSQNGIQPGYNYLLKTDFIETFSPGVHEGAADVPGSVKVGAFFEFKIQANGARQFIINLYNKGTNDRMLHFRSRASDCKFNSLISGVYGPEETVLSHAFTTNRIYILRFTITAAHIQVDVDGSHYHTYVHRTDFTQLTHVQFVSMSDTLTLMEQQRFYIPQF